MKRLNICEIAQRARDQGCQSCYLLLASLKFVTFVATLPKDVTISLDFSFNDSELNDWCSSTRFQLFDSRAKHTVVD